MMDYETYVLSKKERVTAWGTALIITWGMAYLFYKNVVIMLLATPVAFFLVRFQKKRWKEKRYWELNLQFKEGIQSISAALNAGYSIENAIYEAVNDLALLYEEDAYIIKEFQYMLCQLQMNQTVEEVFLDFANRARLEDVTNFVEVFITAKRTGGDLIRIISATSKNINDKIEVKREIKTMITAKKYEANIMCMIPLGIILYMWASSPGYMDCLYNNAFGILFMSVMLVLYIAAYLLCVRLTKIQV